MALMIWTQFRHSAVLENVREVAVCMSDWIDAETHADRAFEMYERGRWAEAEAELRKAIELNPDHAEWHFNLGLTQEAAGRDGRCTANV